MFFIKEHWGNNGNNNCDKTKEEELKHVFGEEITSRQIIKFSVGTFSSNYSSPFHLLLQMWHERNVVPLLLSSVLLLWNKPNWSHFCSQVLKHRFPPKPHPIVVLIISCCAEQISLQTQSTALWYQLNHIFSDWYVEKGLIQHQCC